MHKVCLNKGKEPRVVSKEAQAADLMHKQPETALSKKSIHEQTKQQSAYVCVQSVPPERRKTDYCTFFWIIWLTY
jgi:hypothetical protein